VQALTIHDIVYPNVLQPFLLWCTLADVLTNSCTPYTSRGKPRWKAIWKSSNYNITTIRL